MTVPAPCDDAPGEDEAEGVERRCIVTGARADPVGLIRFVVGPDGSAVPDLDGKLPGRGLWVTGDRHSVAEAVAKRAFSRVARKPVAADEGLADRVGHLLTERLVNAIALARRAGDAVCGYEKVRAVLRSGRASVLLSARDRQADGARKMHALAQGLARGSPGGSPPGSPKALPEGAAAPVPLVDLLDASQLGRPFGRAESVHAAIAAGTMTAKVMRAAERLARFEDRLPIRAIGGGDCEAR